MIHYLPPFVMFMTTVAMAALLALPITRWKPANRVVRFYWRGVWGMYIAIAAVAGGMNTLMLLGVDAVAETQVMLNILLPGVVLLTVVGWFHLVGLGVFKAARRIAR